MARLTDPEKLRCYLCALANWRCRGYIDLTHFAQQQLKQLDPSIQEFDLRKIMPDHVRAGGEIDSVTEARPEWSGWDYHYDLRGRWLAESFGTSKRGSSTKIPTTRTTR